MSLGTSHMRVRPSIVRGPGEVEKFGGGVGRWATGQQWPGSMGHCRALPGAFRTGSHLSECFSALAPPSPLLSSLPDRKTQAVHNNGPHARHMTSSHSLGGWRQAARYSTATEADPISPICHNAYARGLTPRPKLHRTCLQSNLMAPINGGETRLIDCSITNSRVGLTGVYY